MSEPTREQEAAALFFAIRRRGQPVHVGHKRISRQGKRDVPLPPTLVRFPDGGQVTYELLTKAEVAQIAADALAAGPLPPEEPEEDEGPSLGDQAQAAQEGLLSMEAIVRHVQLRDRLHALLQGAPGATAGNLTDDELLAAVGRLRTERDAARAELGKLLARVEQLGRTDAATMARVRELTERAAEALQENERLRAELAAAKGTT